MAGTQPLSETQTFPGLWERAEEGLLGQIGEEEPSGKQYHSEDTGQKGIWREVLTFNNHHEYCGGKDRKR